MLPKKTRVTRKQITYEDETWILILKVVASVKGKKEGEQNWVVQMTDKSKQSSYEAYSTLIINKPENSNKIKVIFER